jgi:effector-binding domain-containing protein
MEEHGPMKRILFLTVFLIVFSVGYMLIHLGVYKSVQLQVEERGPLRLVFKHHIGAYYQIVPTIQEVEDWAKKNSEACEVSFGEYIDDPAAVTEDRLQSNGGCIFNNAPVGALPEGFENKEKPRALYLIGHFDGSTSIGPYKVYPRATKWIKENAYVLDGPVIELYRVTSSRSGQTEWLFPIRKR